MPALGLNFPKGKVAGSNVSNATLAEACEMPTIVKTDLRGCSTLHIHVSTTMHQHMFSAFYYTALPAVMTAGVKYP